VLIALLLISHNLFSQNTQSAITAFNINNKADLDNIVKQVGNKTIVAFGEDTHGTKEYYDLRIAITKKLITEKGFNVFIIENPYEDMIALQDELYTKNMDSLIVQHLFSIYQTKEMKDFLVWLKAYNKTHKIKMAGCDDSYRDILPAKIKTEIKKYKNQQLDSLARDFEDRQLLAVQEYYNLPQHQSKRPLPDEMHYGYEAYLTAARLDSLVLARNIKNAMLSELLFQARSNYDIYDGYVHKLFLSRDSAMGNRINYFANAKNKIIIWANNGHITKKAINLELGKMGQTIHEKNPGKYFAIGFASGAGKYSYIKNAFINDDHVFADTLFQAAMLPLLKGSWHEYLNSLSATNFSIHFNLLKQEQIDVFNKTHAFRMIGYRKENPSKTIFQTPLYPLYDVLIFLKNTNPTTPLFYQ
jgi:erythromycin esterase-like protein